MSTAVPASTGATATATRAVNQSPTAVIRTSTVPPTSRHRKRTSQTSSDHDSCCLHHSQSRSSSSLSQSKSRLAYPIASSRPSLRSRASARAAIEATLCLRVEDLYIDSSSTIQSAPTPRHSYSSSGSGSVADSTGQSFRTSTLTPPTSRSTSPIARGPCSMSYPNYINPEALSEWMLKNGKTGRQAEKEIPVKNLVMDQVGSEDIDDDSLDFQVVDVRDGDYVGGDIKGSAHFPSQEFDPSAIYRRFGHKSKIIFHCAMSQQRGPKAAILYARYLQEQQNEQDDEEDGNDSDPESTINSKSKGPSTLQTVYILRNGFNGWSQKFGKDSRLTEDFAEDIWQI